MIESKKVTVTLTSRVDGDESVNTYPGEYAFREDAHLITYTDYAGNASPGTAYRRTIPPCCCIAYTDEDIEAYLDYAEKAGYRRVILGGHSLGANKVIWYLSRHHDPRVEHFILFSPRT